MSAMADHSWPTEKILGFEWPKTTQMTVKLLFFCRNIFKCVQGLFCLSKQFLQPFFFLQGIFS